MSKKGLYFAAGLGIGAAAGSIVSYFITKRLLWDKCEEEIEMVRQLYSNHHEEANEEDKPDLSKVKEALKKNWEKPPLKSSFEEELAEDEHPMDSDEDEEWEDVTEEEQRALEQDIEFEEEKREMEGTYPVIISEGEASELGANWEEREWTYFSEDDTMTDEDDQIVEDFRRFIGNVLDDSGWLSDPDADDVIVKSGEFMSFYRITKLFKAFADTDAASHQIFADLNKPYGDGS